MSLLVKKLKVGIFTYAPQQNSPPHSCHQPPQTEINYTPGSLFWKSFSSSVERGGGYEVSAKSMVGSVIGSINRWRCLRLLIFLVLFIKRKRSLLSLARYMFNKEYFYVVHFVFNCIFLCFLINDKHNYVFTSSHMWIRFWLSGNQPLTDIPALSSDNIVVYNGATCAILYLKSKQKTCIKKVL